MAIGTELLGAVGIGPTEGDTRNAGALFTGAPGTAVGVKRGITDIDGLLDTGKMVTLAGEIGVSGVLTVRDNRAVGVEVGVTDVDGLFGGGGLMPEGRKGTVTGRDFCTVSVKVSTQSFPAASKIWAQDGKWHKILDALRKIYRNEKGDKPNPTYAITDSQSVKRAHGVERIGYDGGKKIKGRKRQISVDKHGIPLTIKVKASNISNSVLGAQTMNQLARKFPKLRAASADDGYKVKTKQAAKKHGIKLTIAKRICDGFKVLPKRWIVERTFAWFNNFRILSKDYCRKTASAVTEVLIASSIFVINKIMKIKNQ